MFDTVLGLFKMPVTGAGIGNPATRGLMLGQAVFIIHNAGIPHANGFIPVCAEQLFAVVAKGHARIEDGIPVTLRRRAK